MLPRVNRLTTGAGFRLAIRDGRRAGARTLVVHLSRHAWDQPPTVGLVVSRAVGSAVVRNRVKRRIRHLVAARLTDLPAGAVLVVRALPAAASASSSQLSSDLDRCLERCLAAGPDRGERPAGATS